MLSVECERNVVDRDRLSVADDRLTVNSDRFSVSGDRLSVAGDKLVVSVERGPPGPQSADLWSGDRRGDRARTPDHCGPEARAPGVGMTQLTCSAYSSTSATRGIGTTSSN